MTDEVLEYIEKSVLCWLATVDVFEQRGLKLKGKAKVIKSGENNYEEYLAKLFSVSRCFG